MKLKKCSYLKNRLLAKESGLSYFHASFVFERLWVTIWLRIGTGGGLL
jgi:hypothetical protein